MLSENKDKSKKPVDPWQERIPDTPENVALAWLTTTPEDYKGRQRNWGHCKMNKVKKGNYIPK